LEKIVRKPQGGLTHTVYTATVGVKGLRHDCTTPRLLSQSPAPSHRITNLDRQIRVSPYLKAQAQWPRQAEYH